VLGFGLGCFQTVLATRLSQKSGCGVHEHDIGRNDANVDRKRDLDKDVLGYDGTLGGQRGLGRGKGKQSSTEGR